MIQRQLKLRLKPKQEHQLDTWLWNLTGVWNWAIRKIELDANDGIYYEQRRFSALLAYHGKKLQIPGHVLCGVLQTAYLSWQRCFKKLAKRPKFKGQRNKLTSIPFTDSFRAPDGNKISIPGLGKVRFHRQDIPAGQIKCARLIKRASGWYLCLVIDAEPNPIQPTADGKIGIDPGFMHLLTLSTGEKINHPRELERTENRLSQAQRGRRKKLIAQIHERLANQRKDRNHKLSRRLVSENAIIRFSKDRIHDMATRFGRSVASSGHGQLRRFLAYKCTASGRAYDEPDSKNSTRTCSACGAISGPSGWMGLKVRQWCCMECGTLHDRDVNAAVNTLFAGAGIAHEVA